MSEVAHLVVVVNRFRAGADLDGDRKRAEIASMTELLTAPKSEARKKGTKALVAWGATGAAVAIGFPGWLLVAPAALSAWLTYKWLAFRGKWGLRF